MNSEEEKKEIQEKSVLKICQQTYKIKHWPLNKKQWQLLKASGLANLIHHAGYHVDRMLVTVFREYWSKETNTAHFAGFEMAPSLKDVSYILGLPVTGRVVTGKPSSKNKIINLCLRYLGKSPEHSDIRCGLIRLPWLRKEFGKLPKHPSTEAIIYSTRAYILYLLGATIFSELMPGFISPKYLPFLEDLDKVGEYAWGAAALAHLYRGLSFAARPNANYLCGSATLLVSWIYEYLPLLRTEQRETFNGFPCVRKWNMRSSFKDLASYKEKFDSLQLSNVDWNPYRNIEPSFLPVYCKVSNDVYHARMWLISFNIKEIYVPDRYARQFGKDQLPYQDVPQWQRPRAYIGRDWEKEYAEEIKEFEIIANVDHWLSSRFQESNAADYLQKSFSQENFSGSDPLNDVESDDMAANHPRAGSPEHEYASSACSEKRQMSHEYFESILESIKKDFTVIGKYLETMELPDEVAESIEKLDFLTSNLSFARKSPKSQKKVSKEKISKCKKPVAEKKQISKSRKPISWFRSYGQSDPQPETMATEQEITKEMSKEPLSYASDTSKSSQLSDSSRPDSPLSSDFTAPKKRKSLAGNENQVSMEGVQTRKSSRLSVQNKQFKHRNGKGSEAADPIPL